MSKLKTKSNHWWRSKGDWIIGGTGVGLIGGGLMINYIIIIIIYYMVNYISLKIIFDSKIEN